MKPKVFVSRSIPEEGLRILRRECEVEINLADRNLSKEELIQGLHGKDGVLCLLNDNIDSDVMSSNPNLRVISNYAVGFNNIDIKLATQKQIPVTNTPEVSTQAIADFTMALMLAISRRICEGDKYVREGKYKGWSPTLMLGSNITNKTLGIVGLGSTGKAVAQRAKSFDMKVKYYDVLRNKKFEQENGLTYCSLKDLLKESDFVSLHVPLMPQTKHLIGVKELNIMKRSAYIINTSRGPVIDEEALVNALKHKIIAGAALDVFENEPKLRPGEKNIHNVILTPHIASATKETRGEMAVLAAKNLVNVLKGKKPLAQVNKKVKVGLGYKHPFYMVNGKIVKNKEELIIALENCNDHDYWYHVTNERNDFATWTEDVLKDKTLSDKIRSAEDKKHALKILKTPEAKKPAKRVVKKVSKKPKKAKTKKVKVLKKPKAKKKVKVTKTKKKSAVRKPVRAVKKKVVKKKFVKKRTKPVKKTVKKKIKRSKKLTKKKIPKKKAVKKVKKVKIVKKKASKTKGRKRRKK